MFTTRRPLRALSTVLIVVGVVMLADAIVTLTWQEPVSALYAAWTQQRLADELDDPALSALAAEDRAALRRLRRSEQRLRYLARLARRRAGEGGPLGRILVPAAGVDFVWVEGTDAASLRKGPGHFPATSMPGQEGTVAIAGHRTTYRAPFRRLDDLDPGDEIRLEMAYGDFVYRVERTRIVPPSATWVTRPVGHARLVLTACHPLYSAAKRIVIFARLQATRPAEGIV